MEGGRGTAGETREEEDETKEKQSSAAAGSHLDPTVPEFVPVWPLPPPAPQRRCASLQPLLFPEPDKKDRTHLLRRSRDLPLPCVLCERCFGEEVREGGGGEWERARDDLLRHLLADHSLVIHQVSHIASLRSYCQYWRQRFSKEDISLFCPVIRTNTDTADSCPSEDYYLMSDALPEDRQLRSSLQQSRLEAILEQQQSERNDTEFKRSCLFCGMVVTGNRAPLFKHMLTDHGFNVGQPDNLVFVNEFLDLLQLKLDKLLCLYCEKEFKDRNTLKDHMRKKQHKKINPNNTEYDRFYVINYLEPGRSWQEILAEEDDQHTTLRDEGWDDWCEDSTPTLFCLFCSTHTSSDLCTLTHHMKEAHGFDWGSVVSTDYYLQVKAVNYIRRKIATLTCPACLTPHSSHTQLSLHMEVKGHCALPSNGTTWNQAQYLFPTFENDALLCFLDDNTDHTHPMDVESPSLQNIDNFFRFMKILMS